MAYDFIPTSIKEIEKKTQLGLARGEIISLYNLLLELDNKIDDPIAIDVQKKCVKILPSFEKKITTTALKTKYKFKLKIDFGRGTRGISTKSKGTIKGGKSKESGGGNKGIQFEKDFIAGLLKHQNGEKIPNAKTAKAVDYIMEKYSLNDRKDVQIVPEGEMNKKRPITFTGNNIYVGGSNFNIGSTVTDITLKTFDPKTKRTDNVYLSLKYGDKVTFFNVGIQKILTKDEIRSGTITNAQGLLVLQLFGIQPTKFAEIFNAYERGAPIAGPNVENTFNQVNKDLLKGLIKSGVGYGYELVHMDKRGDVHFHEMTSSALDRVCTPMSCEIHYGGKTGTGKRIDIFVETPLLSLQFNIRSKFRGIVMPTHMMCDYTFKH